MGFTPYTAIRRKIVLDALENFQDTPSKTLARIIVRDNPLLFKDVEDARSRIRMYRGSHGKVHRAGVKLTKYFKNECMAGKF